MEAWRELKVGDRVRIVRLPSDFSVPGHRVDEELVNYYGYLIDRSEVHRIVFIDEWGKPWIEYDYRSADGEFQSQHSLALNDDSWERVKAE